MLFVIQAERHAFAKACPQLVRSRFDWQVERANVICYLLVEAGFKAAASVVWVSWVVHAVAWWRAA